LFGFAIRCNKQCNKPETRPKQIYVFSIAYEAGCGEHRRPTGRHGATNSTIGFEAFSGKILAPPSTLGVARGNKSMARRSEAVRPHKLTGFWFLVRRVRGEFALYDRRNPVRISTGIRILDDPRGGREAAVVAKLDAELQRYWKDKRCGRRP
jgi:hypothetical protein